MKKQNRSKKSPVKAEPESAKSAGAEGQGHMEKAAEPGRSNPVSKPAARRGADASDLRFPVVGIGASAGGLEALEELLSHMPADTGMAFVVVTHQHPGHTSLLPELLGKQTCLPVTVAEDGVKLEPNHLYVGPPGGYLAILHGTLHRMEADQEAAPKLPIDYFFRSLAADQKDRAICIVLSGTGTDGTLGLKAVKAELGMAMVQQPQSAKYAGMPSSAEGTGVVDYILEPSAMPSQLVAYASGLRLSAGSMGAAAPLVVQGEPMQKMFLLLRNRTGHDFSDYKINTIRRRIERRMNVHQIRDPEQYVRYLEEAPGEIDLLFKDLLIGVTSFFRDPESWESLAGGPMQKLLESRPEGHALRAWVPGCASGEEVYSLAIVLRECMDRLKRHFEVQIFGTDLDKESVDTARVGRYSDGIAADVSAGRLERFFTHDEGTYRIRKEIREMIIFAEQNIIKDPPFTKIDILSCRNLLIYLNADLQKRLLPIFHYVMKPGGLLFLGPSESVGGFTDLFEAVDKKWKIFRRRETKASVYAMPEMPHSRLPAQRGGGAAAAVPQNRESQLSRLIERLALARFCPAFVVVNHRGDIVHVHGRTGDYLELAEGHARTNVLDMARDGLPHELASAMRQAVAEGRDVIRENISMGTDGARQRVELTVVVFHDPEPVRGLLMVTFRPVPQLPESKKKGRGKASGSARVETLERELQYLKESYQTTLEELETSNEELKSTNEELQSTNEEMQSTNEEMETSKEEMQSLNEELSTVNTELQTKVEDLSHANDDMQNLLNSTDIATIFLDNELRIKRYTEEAKKIIRLRPADIGRPIGELASTLSGVDLAKDCSAVLDTLAFKKQEVQTSDGGWYLMRVIPYRTIEQVIDGLVLTFVNIKELKEAEQTGEQREYFESIFETVRQPLLVLDEKGLVVSANRSFYESFRLRPKEVVDRSFFELAGGDWNIQELRELLDDILPRSTKFEGLQVDHEFSRVGRRVLLLNARSLDRKTALPGRILLAIEDVTDSYSN